MIFNSELFREDLINKRVIKKRITLREASEETGLSIATLSRCENEKEPDIITFGKLCWWLKKSPSRYFTQLALKQKLKKKV